MNQINTRRVRAEESLKKVRQSTMRLKDIFPSLGDHTPKYAQGKPVKQKRNKKLSFNEILTAFFNQLRSQKIAERKAKKMKQS